MGLDQTSATENSARALSRILHTRSSVEVGSISSLDKRIPKAQAAFRQPRRVGTVRRSAYPPGAEPLPESAAAELVGHEHDHARGSARLSAVRAGRARKGPSG